jgi:hypothetical protein
MAFLLLFQTKNTKIKLPRSKDEKRGLTKKR